uniref:PK domain-containing protein n=1 Tax=Ascaris lumbricoides TaxID=6252 RepID=A0A0M3HKQ4_ASCLU
MLIAQDMPWSDDCPASHDVETLKQMITTGMNIARLNFSHGSYEVNKQVAL